MATIPGAVTLLSRATGTPNVLRLVRALADAGMTPTVTAPEQAAARWAGVLPVDVVALARLPSGTPRAVVDALPRIDDRGRTAPWINGPDALLATHHKPTALARLVACGVPVPETQIVERDDPDEPLDLPGGRFVVKPPTGLAGRGVVVGLDLQTATARARAYAELCGAALVQRLRGDGIDHRVLLVDGEPVASMRRTPGSGDARGSTLYGAHATAWCPDDETVALARRAASALGLDIAGVDLLLDDDGPCVLEVNACPGLTAIEAATGADVAGAIAAACLRRSVGV